MNRQLLLGILALVIFFLSFFSVNAAVTPVAGCVDPQTSTAEEPKWYTVMSSHLTAADRQNRFLVWDGIRLKTEKFDAGISGDQLDEKYLWRLERGSADNKVYIVNRSGKRVFASAGISPTTNTTLSVNETGVEWVMRLCSATGQSNCAEKQYCFDFEGASSSPAYLNAQDASMNFGVTVYNAGVHQASGWFFYEAVLPAYVVNYTGTAEGGSFVIKKGENVIANGESVNEGTLLTVEATADPGYLVKTIRVNGAPLEGNTFTLSAVSEITVEFTDKLVYNCSNTIGGSVSAVIGDILLNNGEEFDRGTTVKLTVATDEHYELSSLLVGTEEKKNELQDNVLTLTDMRNNLRVTATFVKKQYAVTFRSIGDGQMAIRNNGSPIGSGNMFEYGTELNGTLTYSDPTIVILTKNGEDIQVVNKAFSFTVDGPTEIIAEFKGATYTVTYSTNLVGGRLKVTDDTDPDNPIEITSGTELPKNTEITVEPVAEAGYELSTFVVDNEDILQDFKELYDGQYWITLTKNVSISVSFTQLEGITGAEVQGIYYNRAVSVLYAPERSVVKVYNIMGGLVSEGIGAQNLSKLPSGNYIAKVKTDNEVCTIKLVKK
ncbi:T9SS type A sorting domain-containing protein [Coprobacter sp.]